MFGYVKPFKPDMKIRDFETYQSVYCGLCRQLGHSFGPFAKLTLSYDFTFLAMMAMAVTEENAVCETGACPVNPFKKRKFVADNKALEFSAACAMIMLYYKTKDSIADRGFSEKIKALLFYPFSAHARKKAAKKYPDIDTVMQKITAQQAEIELKNSPVTDEAAEPTAQALSTVFSLLNEDETQKRVLGHIGYMLGRYIYLCDAFDDIQKDIDLKNYNPFVTAYGKDDILGICSQARASLNLTTASLCASYELIDIHHYKDILDNIIYQGLPANVQVIANKYKTGNLKAEGEL